MWASSSRAGAAPLQLSLTLGRSTYRLRLPSLLTPTSSTPSTSYLTPALATASPSCAPTAAESSSEWGIGSLWNGILLAVPKKKVSHSRKSMRSANKGLKDRVDLVHCSACGKPKLHHHICGYCYFELNRARKTALKGEARGGERAQHQQQ